MLFVELIWKNLRERPTRSLLTALGMAVAVAAIATLWNTAWGYADSSRNYYARRDVDIVVVRAGVSNRLTSRMSGDLGRRIASVPGVARVDGILTEMVSLGDAKVIGIPLRGYASGNPTIDGLQMNSGRKLVPTDHGVVLLGNAMAESLGKRAGDKLEIEGRQFDVVGVFLASNPFDSNSILAQLSDVQKLMDRPGVVSEYQVGVDSAVRNDGSLGDVCRQIEALQDDANQPIGLKAQRTQAFVNSATEAKLGSAMAWATTAIVIALSFMGMLNTMLMSVLDRTRELGILRAVGWTRARVVKLILGESFVISLIGAVLGSSIAWIATRLLSHWPRTSLLVPSGLSLTAIGLGFVAAIGTGVLGSFYPAFQAAGVPPIESLRHE